MNKPRIRKRGDEWLCACTYERWVRGKTPRDAYERWRCSSARRR